MLNFSDLIVRIREEAGLNQAEFAEAIGVSKVLISMIETGQKEVSKNFIIKLAEMMEVHPSSITPFLFFDDQYPLEGRNPIEKWLIDFGEKMQKILIETKAKKLKAYARK